MRKKRIWGLATLILIIGLGIGGVLFMRHSDPEPEKVYNVPSEEVIRQSQKANAPRPDIIMAEGAHADSPPPAEPGFKWVRHGNHWDKVPVSQMRSEPTAEYGITRQGTRYLKNPMWADRKEAHMIPEGEPLNIDWSNYNIAIGNANWWDPRTWESYRNYFGFDRPKARANGTMPYRARIDNWGTPLQWHENIALVVEYRKRRGFRPTPEQFETFKSLNAQYKSALLAGNTLTANSLKLELNTLVASAQGELPDPGSYGIDFFGDPYPGGGRTPRNVLRARKFEAIKNLYIRLGIEHLFEYYENPN